MSKRFTFLFSLVVVGLLAGCGLGADGGTTDVKLNVTQDFGRKLVGNVNQSEVPASDTVMRLLQRNFKVETRYGGGFVLSIDGLPGESDKNPPIDWFYYVNGSLAKKGAASTEVNPGDSVWWDRRDWSVTDRVPAVVGSFPEPFLNGFEGKRVPTRVECASGYEKSCDRVVDGLSRAGVAAPLASLGSGSAARDVVLRVLVGPWEEVRKDDAIAPIKDGPKASGVYATPSADSIETLDADGEPVRKLGAGSGLIAATTYHDNVPTWVITGVDQAGVRDAANVFDETHLRNAFALAVVKGKAVRLPEEAAK